MSARPVIKFAVVSAILHALKTKKPFQWSAFLTLSPLIKQLLQSDLMQTQPQLTNYISSCILFSAAHDAQMSQDYISSYIWLDYLKDKCKNLLDSIQFDTKYSQLKFLGPSTWSRIIYSALYAQMLSHTLAPPNSFNSKNLSGIIRKVLYNPVWLNQDKLRILWNPLITKYISFNVVLFGVIALSKFRTFCDQIDKAKHGILVNNQSHLTTTQVCTDFVRKIFNQSNVITNTIFVPNILAILWFRISSRRITKTYVKTVGFISALITFWLHQFESQNRQLNDEFLKVTNFWILRTFLISKWRTAKQSKLNSYNWTPYESALMSLGVLVYLNKFDKGERGLAKLIGYIK